MSSKCVSRLTMVKTFGSLGKYDIWHIGHSPEFKFLPREKKNSDSFADSHVRSFCSQRIESSLSTNS